MESRIKKGAESMRLFPRRNYRTAKQKEGSGEIHLKCKTLQQKGCRLARAVLRIRRTEQEQLTLINHEPMRPLLQHMGQPRKRVEAGLKFSSGPSVGSLLGTPSAPPPPPQSEQSGKPNSCSPGPRRTRGRVACSRQTRTCSSDKSG